MSELRTEDGRGESVVEESKLQTCSTPPGRQTRLDDGPRTATETCGEIGAARVGQAACSHPPVLFLLMSMKLSELTLLVHVAS